MSDFTDPLEVEFLQDAKGDAILREGRTQWVLRAPLHYHVGAEESDVVITVPPGFITDFASIPRLLWRYEPPAGQGLKAAVVHDFLYSRVGIVETAPDVIEKFTRAQSDGVFLEAMGVLNIPWLKRHVLWLGVRLGGWMGWGH